MGNTSQFSTGGLGDHEIVEDTVSAVRETRRDASASVTTTYFRYHTAVRLPFGSALLLAPLIAVRAFGLVRDFVIREGDFAIGSDVKSNFRDVINAALDMYQDVFEVRKENDEKAIPAFNGIPSFRVIADAAPTSRVVPQEWFELRFIVDISGAHVTQIAGHLRGREYPAAFDMIRADDMIDQRISGSHVNAFVAAIFK